MNSEATKMVERFKIGSKRSTRFGKIKPGADEGCVDVAPSHRAA
jgi:hypothetical protein